MGDDEMDPSRRVGKFDHVISGNLDKEEVIQVGVVINVSDEFKSRIGDGRDRDVCGEPIYFWIYPKFYPSEFAEQVSPDSVTVIGRRFRIGDLVKTSNDEIGFVQDVFHKITAKALNYDIVLHNIDSERLVDPWNSHVLPNRPILYQGWVGVLGSIIHRTVYCKFKEYYIFKMNWEDLATLTFMEGIVESPEFTYEVNGFSFYPGRQFFIAEKSVKKENMLGRIEWIHESPPKIGISEKTVPITVIRTDLTPVNVKWIYQLDSKAPMPSELLKARRFRKVVWLRPLPAVEFGDVRLYKMDKNDWESAINRIHWIHYLIRRYALLRSDQRKRISKYLPPIQMPFKKREFKGKEFPVEIINVTSMVQVEWVSGQMDTVRSPELIKVRPVSGFSIGSFVQRAGDGVRKEKYGVVQYVNLNPVYGDTALVKWIERQQGLSNFLGRNIVRNEELKLGFLETHTYYDFRSESNQNVIAVRKEPVRRYHGFRAGFVINTHPDGMVRAKDFSGKICNLWPDELIRVLTKL